MKSEDVTLDPLRIKSISREAAKAANKKDSEGMMSHSNPHFSRFPLKTVAGILGRVLPNKIPATFLVLRSFSVGGSLSSRASWSSVQNSSLDFLYFFNEW